jgi:hypothetical protein
MMNMTLKKALRLLRRFQDWRCGFDERTMDASLKDGDAPFTTNVITTAIDRILAHHKLGKPFTVCERCQFFDPIEGTCKPNVQGECGQFKECDGEVDSK